MIKLLNTPIIGPMEKTVASSWIDMLAGLSGKYIRRTPPAFCARATPDVASSQTQATNQHDRRVMSASLPGLVRFDPATVRAEITNIAQRKADECGEPPLEQQV